MIANMFVLVVRTASVLVLVYQLLAQVRGNYAESQIGQATIEVGLVTLYARQKATIVSSTCLINHIRSLVPIAHCLFSF